MRTHARTHVSEHIHKNTPTTPSDPTTGLRVRVKVKVKVKVKVRVRVRVGVSVGIRVRVSDGGPHPL